MPAEVFTDPLRVVFVFSDATRYTLRLHHLPCPLFVGEMAHGLAALAHPHGPMDSVETAMGYRAALGRMARFLDSAGFRGGAAELTRARLVEFWLGVSRREESPSRRMLLAWDGETGGLRREVRDYLGGRALNSEPRRTPLLPYSDAEWTRLLECCKQVTDTAWAEQRAAVAAVRGGRDPAVAGWSEQNMLWLHHRYGPRSAAQVAEHMRCSMVTVWKNTGGVTRTAPMLFPTVGVALAYRLLLGMTSGIVPDGLDDLGVGDIDWAGDTTVLLDYVKGRSGPQSLTLPKAAVRVLRRWLAHSAGLRRWAPEQARSRLWLAYSRVSPIHVVLFDHDTIRRFVEANTLVDDDGKPLSIHRSRIRATFHQRRDKRAWTGRTTIDPNHTAQVEGDHYLSRPSPAQRNALEAVIEDAQSDLVRKATTAVVIASADPVSAARELPAKVVGLNLSEPVIVELIGGERDVFTAACADQLAGLHGPAGRPCPARPWVCLLCPLAIFAPRHAPNLLRLKAFFARQFRQMPVPQFIAVFGPYAHRLDQDILPRFAMSILTAAADQVADNDAELPLRPEETTA
ncbi:hypothetical protein DMB66_41540 [Actinoplanes sp. ATCC 53533]|uniref:hypothetical protein n=1 Tax=Actinoplanes sp. ATCC 53533 TaxID=1288362 RepID=UPI000F76AD02|nr:hypothetical protein [Actinoplanes sp. ATCC 53533]RSM51558.1 hypothetical protein DMB66_41540 [Actinoplanes sp. ATCC 53533]